MASEETLLRDLVRLTEPLLGEVSLEQALHLVADAAVELTPGNRSSVRILDRSGARVLGGALRGEDGGEEPMALEAGVKLLGRVLEEEGPVRFDDTAEDGEEKEGDGTGSLLGVPLRSAGQLVGVLGVTSPDRAAFTEEHERAVVLLAACAAPVIERLRMELLTLTDEGTLAYNNRYLKPRLRQEIARTQRHGHPLAILFMDLDQFRQVNEVHGRVAGDVVLQRFADRVRASVRLSDVLIRMGGEEFILIATNTDLAAAATVAERIRRRLADTPILEDRHGTSITQTVSIGIAAYTGEERADDFVARATGAVRRGTSLGGDRVIVAERESRPPPPPESES